MADCDIFREQLAIKYPFGDVGFIRKGKFRRLFNALLPANDPSHECGVPEYHEPLVPNLLDHLETDSLARNHYCSAGVSVEPDPGYHSRPGDIPQVTFKHNRTRGAAVLSLPVTALREDTLSQGDFKLWIVKYIDSWFAFARKLGLGIERMEEIILVTGCDRTKSWANIAFLENEDDSRVSFGVRVENPDPSITFQFSPENAQGAVLHHGPEGENLPENQCVFIRGYRVARTFWMLPRRLKAAAGPSTDPDGYDCDPDMEVISIPAVTKYRDPLYLLLDYIAEQASDCDMVLTHDDDLVKIDGLGHDSSLEALEPDVMMDLLRRSNMEIHKGASTPKVSGTDSGPSTDTSVVKPQTPRRSKRHHPVVFTAGNSSSLQARHDKWTSPLHTRSTTSADLVDDEESTVDATTTFYSDFSRSSRATGRSAREHIHQSALCLAAFVPGSAWFESTFNRIRQFS
ncbi:hypothetical protein BGY98DRAFT_1098257 [Russula aff. rugulosa BPL654]|nr:hypothetical protein BGY98DRAFT_1098257 [Russula aff. rugulosa BPL654]